jgi:hypothetical protein
VAAHFARRRASAEARGVPPWAPRRLPSRLSGTFMHGHKEPFPLQACWGVLPTEARGLTGECRRGRHARSAQANGVAGRGTLCTCDGSAVLAAPRSRTPKGPWRDSRLEDSCDLIVPKPFRGRVQSHVVQPWSACRGFAWSKRLRFRSAACRSGKAATTSFIWMGVRESPALHAMAGPRTTDTCGLSARPVLVEHSVFAAESRRLRLTIGRVI